VRDGVEAASPWVRAPTGLSCSALSRSPLAVPPLAGCADL